MFRCATVAVIVYNLSIVYPLEAAVGNPESISSTVYCNVIDG